MKKIISLLLVLVLCAGLLSTAAFAEEEEKYDVIEFERVKSKTSNNGHFALITNSVDMDGWRGGDNFYTLTITATDDLIITSIEAEIGFASWRYNDFGISGNAIKQPMFKRNGVDMASITNINSSEFSFTGGVNYLQFKNITIYYEEATPCMLGRHSYGTNNICSICGKTKCEAEGHSYGADNVCVTCGKTKCEVEGHDYEKGVCTVCQHECENEFHNGVYVCPDCYMEFDPTQGNPLVRGSTLSQGNMTIVCSIASLAVGVAATLLITKKRKPAAANGANSGDEE